MQRKATFIDQVMRRDTVGRSIDDIGDAALSYAEVKALATGNPLIMERAGVASDLVRLERQLTAHHRDQTNLARTHAGAQRQAERLRAEAAVYRAAALRRQPTTGDRFTMVVAGTRHDKRPDAGAALQHQVLGHLDRLGLGTSAVTVVGHLGGHDVELRATRDPGGAYGQLGFAGLPGWATNFTRVELRTASPVGLVTRLENRLAGLEARAQEADDDARRAETESARASKRIGADFDLMPRVNELRTRLTEIDTLLAALEEPGDSVQAPPPAGAADAVPGEPSPPEPGHDPPTPWRWGRPGRRPPDNDIGL